MSIQEQPLRCRKEGVYLERVTGLVVKALDYGVRGCGFESHQLLPRKGFLQSLWFPSNRRGLQYRHLVASSQILPQRGIIKVFAQYCIELWCF